MKKRKRRNIEIEELDITSLLDILVILLVFLLKSFNDSDLKVDLINELSLPISKIQKTTTYGPVLQVNNQNNVYLNNKLLGEVETLDYQTLKVELEIVSKKSIQKKMPEGLINILLDKKMFYKDIQKLMDICALAGYTKYKLIVQGDE